MKFEVMDMDGRRIDKVLVTSSGRSVYGTGPIRRRAGE